MQTLRNAGAEADICIWHEPYYEGLPANQFIAAFRYYAPAIRPYYPVVFCTSVQSVYNNNENAWYPGDAHVDICATDMYAYEYLHQGQRLDLPAEPANNATPPKPFGIWEWASSTDSAVGQTPSNSQAFFTYLTNYFTTRRNNGQPNNDLIWFNAAGRLNLTGNNTTFETGTGDWLGWNANLTHTTSQARTGTGSARLTATAAGDIDMYLPDNRRPSVTPGWPVTFTAWYRPAVTRSVQNGVGWIDAAGGWISSDFPGGPAAPAGTWTRVVSTLMPPPGTVSAHLDVQVMGAALGEVCDVDDITFQDQSALSSVLGLEFGATPLNDHRVAQLAALWAALWEEPEPPPPPPPPPPPLESRPDAVVSVSPLVPGLWTFWADRYVSPGVFAPAGPLQATSFNCIRRLSGYGTGDIIIIADTSALTREELLRLWSWRLWAYFDGQPAWCGLATGVTDEGRGTVSFTLAEVTGYLRKRQYDLAGAYGVLEGGPPATHRRYSQVEQVNIARDLAAPVADMGVTITTRPGAGFPRDRRYAFLESESRAQLLRNLSEVIDGPDFVTRYYTGADGLPRAELVIADIAGPGPGLSATVPGSALDYTLKWDGDEFRTRTYAVGEAPEHAGGEDVPKLSSMVDVPQAGFPRLDAVDDWPGVTLASTLAERAQANAATYAAPVLDASVNVPAASPPVTSYHPGDSVQLLITGPLQPDGFEITGRLAEVSYNARESRASWTVTVTRPPARPRQTLIGQLASLHQLATGVFRQGVGPPA